MFERQISNFKTNYNNRKAALREHGIFKYVANSSGYVLIIVLLMSSLLISVSSEFMIVAQTNMSYIRKFSERLKAYTLARAGVTLSKEILKADQRGLAAKLLGLGTADENIDCYNDIWAMDFPVVPLEDGYLKIEISDENSKINLSVLANEAVPKTKYYGIAQRFFLNMGLPMDLADTIIDWVDPDDSRFSYGAESSDHYLTLETPYNAKNAEMDSIDELLLIKGITPEIFYGMGGDDTAIEGNLVDSNKGGKKIDLKLIKEMSQGEIPEDIEELQSDFSDLAVDIGKEKSRRLSDYFRVHGNRNTWTDEVNKININTASYRVLSALSDNMTEDAVIEIINTRNSTPYKNVKKELEELIEEEDVRKNILTVKSYIFKIVSTATMYNTTVKITGIYNRRQKTFLYWSEE